MLRSMLQSDRSTLNNGDAANASLPMVSSSSHAEKSTETISPNGSSNALSGIHRTRNQPVVVRPFSGDEHPEDHVVRLFFCAFECGTVFYKLPPI